MPTLRNRTTKSGCCVRWKPHPEHGRPSTYQISHRGLRFLRTLGYSVPTEGDEVEIPDGLCRPLRVLDDLHFKDEESPGNVDLTDVPDIANSYNPQLSDEKKAKLREYIETHPRLTSEKENELQQELTELRNSTDVDITNNSNPQDEGEGIERGPAASLDIDVDQIFGNDRVVSEEITSILRKWEPDKVIADDESTTTDNNDEGTLSRSEFHEVIASFPRYHNSIIEFNEHPREVREVLLPGDGLMYAIRDIEYEHAGTWHFVVFDGRGSDSTDYDLQFYLEPSDDQFRGNIHHLISIRDEQFVKWRVFQGGTDITSETGDGGELVGNEFHRVLHDRTAHLHAIEEFVANLGNANIGEPVDWWDS